MCWANRLVSPPCRSLPARGRSDIAKRAMASAKVGGYDVVILDTAGRQHVDEQLMAEVASVKALVNPHETLLVADALTGQDAVNIAKSFHDRVAVSGIILTRVDGDGRGGAALSMRFVTGAPIKFLGAGEKLDALEAFHPERVASRILDMGDVVSLVERASETLDKEEAEKIAAKMKKGTFDMNDLKAQLNQMKKLGGMKGVLGMLPGVGKIKGQLDAAGLDDKILTRQEAIIQSMTKTERTDPDLDQRLAPQAHRRRRRGGSVGSEQASQNASPDGGHDEENGQRRPHADDARHGRRYARWITARNVSGTALTGGRRELSSKRLTALNVRKTEHGSSHSSCPRRHQETPALQHRRRRQPQSARRPLHREDRLLQSAAAVRSCRPPEAGSRRRQGLDRQGRRRFGPRAQVPGQCRPGEGACTTIRKRPSPRRRRRNARLRRPRLPKAPKRHAASSGNETSFSPPSWARRGSRAR